MDVPDKDSPLDAARLTADGWFALEVGGFNAQVGPLWIGGAPGARIVGFFAEPRHSNTHMGTVHGGVLMTFADIALGYGVVEALGAPRCVTAQLQLHFVSRAKIGAFVTCRPEVVKMSSQLAFMRGVICVGEESVASADGIWKVLEQRTP